MKSALWRRKRVNLNNIGFVVGALSLASLGIIRFILTENQFTLADSINSFTRSDYNVSQLVRVGATCTVVMSFGLTILGAIGINREST